jgi:hypothetical protein
MRPRPPCGSARSSSSFSGLPWGWTSAICGSPAASAIRDVAIEWATPATALPASEPPGLVEGLVPLDEFLVARTAFYGDYSLYTLQVVAAPGESDPLAGFDPRLTRLQFSFKVECESDFDCAAETSCRTPSTPAPRLSYLAKDYATFRRLMLDRMSATAPEWRERNPADVGIALVELLAYVADHLSYHQDAVATEAYLATARRRVSLRRHARLMDYAVHDGCNARAWVRTLADFDGGEPVRLQRGTPLLTRVPGIPTRLVGDSIEHREALARGAEVFETVDDALLYEKHERIDFYTWGDRECCLPRGATRATLAGDLPKLKAGDVLLFVEEIGPRTGHAEDADRSHRWAVRLTHAHPGEDPSGGLFLAEPSDAAVPVTGIEWAMEDALPFPLCLSSRTDEQHGSEFLTGVSAAYGNIVLADHGRTVAGEPLGTVPPPHLRLAAEAPESGCAHAVQRSVPPRFRPTLKERPLTCSPLREPRTLFGVAAAPPLVTDLDNRTFSQPLRDLFRSHGLVFRKSPVVQGGDGNWSVSDGEQAIVVRERDGRLNIHASTEAASQATAATARRATPEITLESELAGTVQSWQPRIDLLGSGPEATDFVVEVEHAAASLRFGDDIHGKRPNTDATFAATYRVGNGVAGNVGAESMAHIVTERRAFRRRQQSDGGIWRGGAGECGKHQTRRARSVPGPGARGHA